MSTDPARDRSTDALLRAALPGLPAGDVAACLSAETLAAWSEGSLASSEAARADAHLAECGRCQQMLAAFVRTAPVAAAAVPFWQRWPRRWLVPVSAVAAAALIVAVVMREGAPPVQMAKVEAPAEPSRLPSAPAALSEPAPSAAPEPRALSDLRASSDTPPSRGARRADADAANGGLQRRTEERLEGQSVQGGMGALSAAAPPPPPPPPPANVNPVAAPVETLPTTVRQEPAPAAAPKELAKAHEADRAKPESAQVTNVPLDASRNYQGQAVLVPEKQADAAAANQPRTETLSGVSEAVAVVAEIVSAPRPALSRTSAGRGGGVRGPDSARAAAEDAAAAAKLPATIPARWRVFANGRVDRSTNAGATWRPVSVDTPVPLTGGSSPSDLVCWLIGPNGVVLLSTDGARFTRLPFPEPATLASITAVNDRAATVRTSDGRTFATGDGGGSWKEQ